MEGNDVMSTSMFEALLLILSVVFTCLISSGHNASGSSISLTSTLLGVLACLKV